MENWRTIVYQAKRDVPGVLKLAGNTMAHYLRELERRRLPDAVVTQQTEKRRCGDLLKAARDAVEHPKVYNSSIHGTIPIQANLRRAIERVNELLRDGEDYPWD